jgi:hypothetical protein
LARLHIKSSRGNAERLKKWPLRCVHMSCVQVSTVVYSRVQLCTIVYNRVQLCTIVYNRVQLSTVVYSRLHCVQSCTVGVMLSVYDCTCLFLTKIWCESSHSNSCAEPKWA